MKNFLAAVFGLLLGFGVAYPALADVTVLNKQGLCLFARGVDYDDHAIWASNLADRVNVGPYVPGMKVQVCHSQRPDCLTCYGLHDATWYECTITRADTTLNMKFCTRTHKFMIKGADCVKITRDRI